MLSQILGWCLSFKPLNLLILIPTYMYIINEPMEITV